MTKRPEVLHGKTYKKECGCGNIYITLNRNEDDTLEEVMLQIGKVGTCANVLLRIIGILLSVILQVAEDPKIALKTIKLHLLGQSCSNSSKLDDKRFSSCGDVIARVMIELLEKQLGEEKHDKK